MSDLNRSLSSRQFLNVANERTCFASCACAFESSGLITRLECTSALQQNKAQLRLLYLLTGETQYYTDQEHYFLFRRHSSMKRNSPVPLQKARTKVFGGLLSP